MSGILKADVSRSGWVYALYDPRHGKPRYVGQTRLEWGPIGRLKIHIRESLRKADTRIHKWIRRIIRDGFQPAVHVLEAVPDGCLLDQREIFWIQEGRRIGWNLTNHASGGWSGFTRRGMRNSKEHNEKVSRAAKGRKLSDRHRQRISETKKSDVRLMRLFASQCHIGGAAAAKKRSVPHWCDICQSSVPTTVAWRSHQKLIHPEILKEKLNSARMKGRTERWRRHYEKKKINATNRKEEDTVAGYTQSGQMRRRILRNPQPISSPHENLATELAQ